MTSPKIRIVDDLALRSQLVAILHTTEKEILLDYVQEIISVTKKKIDLQFLDAQAIDNTIITFLKWRKKEVNLKILRENIFNLHSLASTETNELTKVYYRFVAHALATAHVMEHLVVALDYLIKYVNIKTDNNKKESASNRLLQINILNDIIKSKQKV